MSKLSNLFTAWEKAVKDLPKNEVDNLVVELKAAQEKMDADKNGCYQPMPSSKRPSPPGAK